MYLTEVLVTFPILLNLIRANGRLLPFSDPLSRGSKSSNNKVAVDPQSPQERTGFCSLYVDTP